MSNHTYTTLPLSSVPSTSLGSLASSLRLALKPSDLSYGIRSLATQISLTPDKSSIYFGANMDFSTDIFFSSWARLECYNLDFNIGLGFPELVRRPRYVPVEGLMYLMPMDRSGGN
jgi:trichothecene 3-O-acetyltransferase